MQLISVDDYSNLLHVKVTTSPLDFPTGTSATFNTNHAIYKHEQLYRI